MPLNKLRLLSKFIFFLLFSIPIIAQNSDRGVLMTVENDISFKQPTLLSLVVVIENTNATTLSGKLKFEALQGFRNLSGDNSSLKLAPGETRHIPVKFIIGADAMAGTSVFICKLTSADGTIIAQHSTTHTINQDNTLTITPIESTIYRLSNNQPIAVKVKVSNKGNISQSITLVCKFPDPSNSNLFIEQNATLAVKKDSIFTFTYLPSKVLVKQSTYTVRISGFRNPDKEIFGNTTVDIQNISSTQQYQAVDFTNFTQETSNEISASYRRLGGDVDFYQLKGSGGINIPSGYLFLRGNVALSNSQQAPLVTNTNLTYRQGSNEFSVGNISKLFEMIFVGRGAEYSHTFNKKEKIEFGFIDQNYNLLEENSWLKYGYGFYANAILNPENSTTNLTANYLYSYDPFEKAKHNIIGTTAKYEFNRDWSMITKLNGGLSTYDLNASTKTSFAAESNYIGKIKDVNLNGNYFFSTDYYPGNRRGNIQLQQSFSTPIKKHNVYANVTYANFAPKYYSFDTTQESANTRLDIGIRFPKFKSFSYNLAYQYQSEQSNSFSTLLGNLDNNGTQKMAAHRIAQQFSWVNNISRQSALLGIETGAVRYPTMANDQYQMKINANYNYKNFNINSVYQLGSYYLSEYIFSSVIAADEDYQKLSLSLFYNSNFLNNKLNFNSGFTYVDDIIYGKSPSAFINTRYNGKSFSTFLNSSWYNYTIGGLINNSITLELGVTVRLQNTILNPDKKSTIKVTAFYDRNNNNRLDSDEILAANYTININTIALRTDEDGTASYKKIPYGIYYLKQFTQDGWYYNDAAINVDRHNYNLNLPLHQSGKVEGKVVFNYNAETALDFEKRGYGITFNVTQNGKLIQKIQTNDNGNFTLFLPTGDYSIVIDEQSLPVNTYCTVKSQDAKLETGKIVVIPPFTINVKEKRINTKKFTN
ncbi:COG1470 family protein [Flavobacterium algicola]|uniref:COG1470 family protein n=1 Tax=Flavobacterium algicola TaxID=556529 RepID=UPI001EFEAEF2|nr:hypothetical protein [Flavobacterium algicola]MCG9792155.1 hypothetical protein [Flavobacterium algicola]